MTRRTSLPWDEWPPPRVAIAAAWFAATVLTGLWLAVRGLAAAGPLLGEQPTGSDIRASALWIIAGGAMFALGPFGMWLVRGNRGWLLGAGGFLFLGVMLALIQLSE